MGRLPLITIALVTLWASLTASQVPVWRSNRALWSHAVTVSPFLARPALNLAVTYRDPHEAEDAFRWLARAGQLGERSPRTRETLAIIQGQLAWWEAFGFRPCSRPDVQHYC